MLRGNDMTVKEEKGFKFIGYKRENNVIHIKDLTFDTGVDTDENLQITITLNGWLKLYEIPQILKTLGWMCTQFADDIVGQLTLEVEADERRDHRDPNES